MSKKTTVYLPDELKQGIEREARRRRVSEAEVIRTALTAALPRWERTGGIFSAPELSAERVDELLAGFGER